MISIRNLSCGYGKQEILKGVSLDIQQGNITCIVGSNGGGKSTLLKAICGLLPIDSGEVKVNDRHVQTLTERERAQTIAFLSQGRALPDTTVERMVLHGRFSYLQFPRRYQAKDYAAAEEAMCKVGISHLRDKPLKELSGGMAQKVYIAAALCQGASVLLMDEPTTYLDISQQSMFTDLILQLKQSGKTVLLVLHDLVRALKIADSIVLLENGRVAFIGTPSEVISSGMLQRVFGISIQQLRAGGDVFYYY